MNNNLTPVQRYDRNGKLVTRHVSDAAGSSTAMGNVPAPMLSSSENKPSLTEGLRLVPSQTFSKRRTDSGAPVTYGTEPVFEASEVEMYDVLSVASSDAVVGLLTAGVRSAEEAVDRLSAEGRASELTGSGFIAREMLSRRVAVEFYIMGMERLSEEQVRNADPELLADYLEFFAIRSIMRKDSPQIADEVLAGEISLADVREIGIDHLKTGGRLEIARPALKELKKGTREFTVQDLSKALQKRIGNDVAAEVGYLTRYGAEATGRLSCLGVSIFGGKSIGDLVVAATIDGPSSQEEALAAINYTERLVKASNISVNLANVIEVLGKGKFLHGAGVDVKYAAERIRNEEPRDIASSFSGLHQAVGGGWL